MKHSINVAILILSVVLVLASVFLPVTVYRQTDLLQVRLGWPITFVIQDQGAYPLPFPAQTRLYSVWENPISVLWLQFFFDIAIVFSGVSLIGNLVKVVFLGTSRR